MDTASADTTIYYYDDKLDISPEVTKVRYYVVLHHEGKIKSDSGLVTVPYSADSNWNYEPDEKLEDSAWVQDLTMDQQGHLTVTAHSGTEKPQFTYEAFDTYNEALVAVEQELKKSISLASRNSSIDYDYNYSGTSSESLTKGKYYAFRFVSVSKTAGEADAVSKIIAVPQKSGDAYWLDIRFGGSDLRGYSGTSSSVSVYIEETQANAAGTKYDSVTLQWYGYGSDVQCYNIYRADIPYNPYNYYEGLSYTFVSTKQSESSYGSITYKDESSGLQSISLSRYVVYKVEAVGRYGVFFGYKTASSTE